MNVFSLRTIIDDIMLIVRNNNISESEDLSRDQIRAWVMAYKAALAKRAQDKDEDLGYDEGEDSLQSTIGPLELQDESSLDDCSHVKRTVNKLPQLVNEEDRNILSVTDVHGCIIQQMQTGRKHFHKFRRYTFGEPTFTYSDGYIYIDGIGIEPLQRIYVSGNFLGDDESKDEDEVLIPGWMIPEMKQQIMKNELSFMLNRPSDDDNNSTLSSVKPHGPQDQEK